MIQEQIIKSDISKEMKYRYPIYALDVITDRALPDVRDGLKPVHRRILFAMQELGLYPEKSYRKCARIVGDVLGKYHPHGDSSVYGALVRMAQDFSMRYTLVDGHGNFGSVDGDPAAAMRYTESKMKQILLEMLRDINKNTVDFKPNFDGEELEPIVLPSRYPNILVNGSSGVAVGMSTNIPPHNLGEIIDGTIMLIDNNDITIEELNNYIKAPDFPTQATIINQKDILTMYEKGKGQIILRAKYHLENEDDKKQIVFTEIPYQVNKQKVCCIIADFIRDKKDGFKNIVDIRDESDKEGMRIVVELKKNENEEIIIALLFSKTDLQKTFSAEFRALVNGEPKLLNLKQILEHYIQFQKEVITRRSKFDLDKSNVRLHILEGFKIALDNMDNIISIIRNSKTAEFAKNALMDKFNLSEKQSQVILEMRLRRLTGLEREKINEEYNELIKQIEYLQSILRSEKELNVVIKEELLEIKNKYNDERRTDILDESEVKTIEVKKEDLIEDFTTTLIFSEQGYFKKTRKYSETQKLKDRDQIQTIVQCSNKDKAIFISNQGNAYFLNLWEVNEKTPSTIGDFLPNLLPLEKNESIIGMLTTNQYKGSAVYVFENSKIAKIPLTSFETKTNRIKLSNAITQENGKVLLISQITDDVDIELTDCFDKTKIVNTKDINSKASKNTIGITSWNCKKVGFSVVSAKTSIDNK
jgi:DNA gyrase subunit A